MLLIGCAHPSPTPAEAEHLRVMQFNVWLDGMQVPDGINRIADIIAGAKADVVTFSEARQKENPHFIADLLQALSSKGQSFFGQHAGGDVAVISRWPISDVDVVFKRFVLDSHGKIVEDRGSVVAYHLTSPGGRRVIVGAAHLDWQNYTLYLPRGYQGNSPFGRTAGPNTNITQINSMAIASTRLPALHAFMHYLKSRKDRAHLPVILGGDFNDGSHLDWTQGTGSLFDHHGVVYEFPASKMLADAGYVDAWRHVYPDPVRNPGTTWPSETLLGSSTSWATKADERDRIDYIYYRSGELTQLQAKNASLVGSANSYAHNKLVADRRDPFILQDLPWPTDHKVLVADLELLPTVQVV